jgi:hypothetical protein
MEKRLKDKLMEMLLDMKRMLDHMEARDKKVEQMETDKAAREQASYGNQYPHPHQYPPLEMNGYHTNYNPHIAPSGYQYQNMYQGYPVGFAMQAHSPPQQGHQQGEQNAMQTRKGYPSEAYEQQSEAITRPEVRDLNKRLFAVTMTD